MVKSYLMAPHLDIQESTLKKLQKLIEIKDTKDIWIIGGAKLIEGLFDIIAEFHLSKIKGIYDCDTYLPEKFIKEHYLLKQSSKHGDVSFDVWCKK